MNDFATDPLVTFVVGVCLGVLLTIACVKIAEALDKRRDAKHLDG